MVHINFLLTADSPKLLEVGWNWKLNKKLQKKILSEAEMFQKCMIGSQATSI